MPFSEIAQKLAYNAVCFFVHRTAWKSPVNFRMEMKMKLRLSNLPRVIKITFHYNTWYLINIQISSGCPKSDCDIKKNRISKIFIGLATGNIHAKTGTAIF